jgi:hypothetical protein
VGASQQFTATGTYQGGGTQNLTSQVTWASSVPGVATVTGTGLATAGAVGVTNISATLGLVSGSTPLTVVPPGTLTITTTALPEGTASLPYTANLTASGGIPPYTWSIVSGQLPAGLALTPSTGAITGTPTTIGLAQFTVQLSANGETTTKPLSLAVIPLDPFVSVWEDTTLPSSINGPDAPVELGVKFRSSIPGYVTGLRFYKSAGNTGTHVGNLWSETGQLLATVTFTNETPSGWQQISFSQPVAIAANTVYVASYHCPNGFYAYDHFYFATAGVDAPPLHLLGDAESGGNGVFHYAAGSVFPTSTFQSTNYWVDVVFSARGPLQSIAVTPVDPTVPPDGTQQFTATGTYLDGSTENLTSQVTWASSSPSIATVNATGLATALVNGVSTISATSGAIQGNTLLHVTTECSNGIDDDGDGLIDHPSDLGCAGPGDLSERSPTMPCDDGADNDGDGRTDFDPVTFANPLAGFGDPGCVSTMSPIENPQCQDGIDNDPQPGIDFDGGQSVHGACTGQPGGCPAGVSDPDGNGVANPDPDCVDKPWRNKEASGASCGLGAELAALLPLLESWRRRIRRRAGAAAEAPR